MKNNYKNTLVAMLLTVIIVIIGTYIVSVFSSNNKIFTSKSNESSTSKATKQTEQKETSTKVDANKSDVVINDTSTSEAIEASNVGTDIVVDSAASSDAKTIQYFEGAETKIDSMSNNIDKVKTEGKALFVKLVDFIYYDTEINGVKFDDLTAEAKEKIIAIASSIDSKIESKVPGYKETVKDYAGKTYTYLSEKLKSGITYLDTKVAENVNPDTYADVKEETNSAIDTIKDSVSTAIDVSKDVLTSGKEKLKKWYEGWK